MSAFHNSRFKNKPPVTTNSIDVHTFIISARNTKVVQQASLLFLEPRVQEAQESSIDFHTNACVLIPNMTSCNVRNRNVLKLL